MDQCESWLPWTVLIIVCNEVRGIKYFLFFIPRPQDFGGATIFGSGRCLGKYGIFIDSMMVGSLWDQQFYMDIFTFDSSWFTYISEVV
jgi:hypothetical protein